MGLSSSEYIEATKGLEQYGSMLCGLIEELLLDAGIQTNAVDYRVKSIDSAFKKVSSQPDKYTSLTDLTDLLGVRVTTYFPHDVDKVARIITNEFKIDKKNSIDKRKLLDTDRFGYLGLHFVASLTSARCKFIEYRRFAKMSFELQIRSMLQHAWAEIEHDLGYKTEGARPNEARRSFSRLAGLLELADEEFERLREGLVEYEVRVSETIGSAPQTLMIDQSTVVAGLQTEKALIDLDQAIADIVGLPLAVDVGADYAAREASGLKALGIKDLRSLLEKAVFHKEHVARFASHWIKPDSSLTKRKEPLPRGIGLFYLGYVLAAQSKDADLSNWRRDLISREKNLLKEVRQTWDLVQAELKSPNKDLEMLRK